MSARVYVLLTITEDRIDEAIGILHGKVGVKTVDMLEGSPNVITMVEAHDRQRLAKLTVAALASVENVTEDLKLLPVRDECNPFISSRSFGKGRTQKFSTCVPGGKQAQNKRR